MAGLAACNFPEGGVRGAWEKGLQCGRVAELFQHTHLCLYVHFTHTELFLLPADLLAVVCLLSLVILYPAFASKPINWALATALATA